MTPLVLLALVALQAAPSGGAPAIGREAVEALTFPPLDFDPPDADEHEVLGVPIFHLHDPTLPLIDLALQIRGGVAHFPREDMAAVTALPALLRSGGTIDLPPDSVDRRIDLLALDLSLSGGGGGMAAGLNALTERFGPGLDLLGEILLGPRFDSDALEVWRGQEIDRVMRREDDPSSLAISEFNRLMFGEHPVGWVMTPEDLTPERFSTTRLRRVHTSIVCRDRLMLGLSGDLTWEEAEPILRRFLEPWPSCEVDLPAPPVPELRRGGGVFVLAKAVDQSTVIVAGPGGVLQGDSPDYFASRIADYLLGASGFGSRLLSRLRVDEGLAYSAYSIWTASPRHEGIVGAATATGAERTVRATRLVIQTLEEMRSDPPDADEVGRAREQIATGYVFAFGSAAQIVARRMAYRAQELPPGWLERYLEALDEVAPDAVRRVVDEHLDPSNMTVLIVGDPARFDPGLDLLGTIFQLSPDGTIGPWITPSSAPGGGR